MRNLVLHLATAVPLLAATILISIYVLNDLVAEEQFYDRFLKLSNEGSASTFRSQWLQPDVQESMVIHLFEQPTDNLSETVQPVGPFRFIVNQEKLIIEETEDELTYKPFVSYYYDSSYPENNNLTERVRMTNVPMISAETIIRSKLNSTNPSVVRVIIKIFETLSKARPVVDHEAREFIFDGYSDDLIKLIENLQDMEFIKDVIITDGKFSFLQNNTGSEGELTVSKGMYNLKKTGQVVAWNGLRQTTFYPAGSSCNKVRGSNGENFGAFLYDKNYVYIVIPEFCGSVPFKFTRETTTLGLRTRRYEFAFESDHHDACFITDGMHDVSKCNHLAPIVLTSSHSLNSSSSDESISFIEVEPTTGVTIKASINFQINVNINGSQTSLNESTLIPLMSIQRDAQAMDKAVKGVKSLKSLHMAAKVFAWILAFMLNIVVLALVILAVRNFVMRRRSDDAARLLQNENQAS